MKSPARILYLAPCWPTEGLSGWQSRTFQILSALQEFGQLDCIVVGLDDDRLAGSDASNLSCVQRVVKLQPVGSRSVWNRLYCGLDARCISYFGHTASAADRISVMNSLPQYNL